MGQDAARGDGLLVYDPAGRLSNEFLATRSRKEIPRMLIFDLDSEPYPISLNPGAPFNEDSESAFYEWREWLLTALQPLPSTVAACLDFTLRVLHFARHRDGEDQAVNLSALMRFLGQDDYRRYIMACAAIGYEAIPETAVFTKCHACLSQKLSAILDNPQWRGRLSQSTSAKLVATKNWRDKVIIVTGKALCENSLAAKMWRLAFFQHLRAALFDDDDQTPFHIYGLDGEAFNSPLLDGLVAKMPSEQISMTLCPETY